MTEKGGIMAENIENNGCLHRDSAEHDLRLRSTLNRATHMR